MEKMDGKTLDIVQENINKLKEIFPEAFTEGKVDFDKLKEELGNFIDDREERYSFNWNGKRQAKLIAQTPSTGTLRPCPEESVDWENTKNIFIEGDNLEVLKLLQKSYHKKVKMIYIDPPYNTGNDFIYKDDFKDNIKNYKAITGQLDEEGKNITNNPETSGRYHTDWLNMMYPRLKLAKNLLRDDGVIFISIDDNEVDNLKKICNEIFGEENFVAEIVWEKMYTTKNDSSLLSNSHEYILLYARCITNEIIKLLPRTQEMDSRYTNPDNDIRGPWKPIPLYAKGERKNGRYPVISPFTKREHWPNPDSHWLYSEADTNQMINDNRIYFGKDGNAQPNIKRFLSEVQQGTKSKTLWKYNEVGSNDSAKRELRTLYENETIPFDFPKPTTLIKRTLQLASDDNDIILDFFSGSCTTAHAVLDLNKEDGGNRKFIMVQLPEPCDEKSEAYKAGFKTIADIGKERIRRVINKIKEEKFQPSIDSLIHEDKPQDLGFKLFKLDSTNLKPWEVDFDLTQRELEDYISNIKDDRDEHDILYEVLLKLGLDLTLPITEHIIDGQKVYDIGMGALMVCLSDNISITVAEGIVALKAELQPEIMRVVFKDSGFADKEMDANVVKANILHVLKDAGIEDVRSL